MAVASKMCVTGSLRLIDSGTSCRQCGGKGGQRELAIVWCVVGAHVRMVPLLFLWCLGRILLGCTIPT